MERRFYELGQVDLSEPQAQPLLEAEALTFEQLLGVLEDAIDIFGTGPTKRPAGMARGAIG